MGFNEMNRTVVGVRTAGLAAAIAGFGAGLRWVTADSLERASTADLESMAALATAAVAWAAYGWMVLAVVATLLEQVPGALGRTASAVAVGITSDASRRLFRSAIGVAAATPLTIAAAHAAPAVDGSPGVHAVQRKHTGHDWAPLERPSSIRLTGPRRHGTTIELPSTVHAAGPLRFQAPVEQPSRVSLTRARQNRAPVERPARAANLTGPRQEKAPAERPARVDLTEPRGDQAPIEQPSTVSLAGPQRDRAAAERPAGADLARRSTTNGDRIVLPDRPTVGTPTRYAEIRPTDRPKQPPPARSPIRVLVRKGDTLWAIAAKELGPDASNTAIAERWPQWYAANARVIGDDPDLLLPGQVLRAPKRASPPVRNQVPDQTPNNEEK
jgi:nucleoid-associated protein YgaU